MRKKEGFFIIEGMRGVLQIASDNPEYIDEILTVSSSHISSKIESFPLRIFSKNQFETISTSVTPQGIAAVLRMPKDIYSSILPSSIGDRLLVLDEVQDPGNVGTIIRSAAAFDFSGLLLSIGTADPFSPKAVQSSAGAIFTPWIRRLECVIDTIIRLKRRGYHLYCAEPSASCSIDSIKESKVIIALGNEGTGISNELLNYADGRYAIPMTTSIESLNVAVAGAISMFTLYRNHTFKQM